MANWVRLKKRGEAHFVCLTFTDIKSLSTYTHTHTHIHTHTHTYTHTHIHTHIHTHAHAHTRTHTHTYVRTRTCTYCATRSSRNISEERLFSPENYCAFETGGHIVKRHTFQLCKAQCFADRSVYGLARTSGFLPQRWNSRSGRWTEKFLQIRLQLQLKPLLEFTNKATNVRTSMASQWGQ